MNATPELPHSTEAEQSVLGALMMSPESLPSVRAQLREDHFFHSSHRAIFKAAMGLADAKRPVDPTTVADALESAETAAYALEIAAGHYSVANLPGYVDLVRRSAAKRRQVQIGQELIERGMNCAEPEDIAAYGISSLSGILTTFSKSRGEPMDVFGDSPTTELQPEWLPPGIAEYAIDQGRVIGVHPEMIAMGCLTTIAAALDDAFVICPKPNEPKWRERACLWAMVIAPPGSKKSVAIRRPMEPLSKINNAMISEFTRDMGEYMPKLREFNIRERSAEKRRANGEGFEEREDAPSKPAQRRIIINDVTTEKLGELFQDNTRGMLYSTDELALWFSLFDAYSKNGGGKDRAYALRAYEGGETTFDRKGSGTTHVTNWSYSVVGTTQPDKIREIARDSADDGLFQRFMCVEVSRKGVQADFDHPENEALARDYTRAIQDIYAMKPGNDPVVKMGPEAASMYREFCGWVERMSTNDSLSPMLLGHLGKWSGLWARLCLVYHAYGCALAGKYPATTPIAARTAERVTAFMQRFLLPQALRFYGSTIAEGNKLFSMAQSVAAMILSDGLMTVTSREIHFGCGAWRTATEWQRKAAIGLLRDGNWLSDGESAWVVNPMVHGRYAERALMERDRRTDAAEKLRELRELARGNRVAE